MNILNIANSIKINPKIKYIGIRPEKSYTKL